MIINVPYEFMCPVIMIITIIISIQGALKDYITQTTVVWGLFNVLMQYLTVLQTHIFRFMNDTFCAHMLPVKRCPLFGWKWSFSHHCNALRHIKEMDCSVPAALRGPPTWQSLSNISSSFWGDAASLSSGWMLQDVSRDDSWSPERLHESSLF